MISQLQSSMHMWKHQDLLAVTNPTDNNVSIQSREYNKEIHHYLRLITLLHFSTNQ
jgi:hypothetical protein